MLWWICVGICVPIFILFCMYAVDTGGVSLGCVDAKMLYKSCLFNAGLVLSLG